MKIPTIHINGTGKQCLLDAIENALDRIRETLTALEDVYPNGRDYYLQGDDAFRTAANEHSARVTKIAEVQRELQEIRLAIYDQRSSHG